MHMQAKGTTDYKSGFTFAFEQLLNVSCREFLAFLMMGVIITSVGKARTLALRQLSRVVCRQRASAQVLHRLRMPPRILGGCHLNGA